MTQVTSHSLKYLIYLKLGGRIARKCQVPLPPTMIILVTFVLDGLILAAVVTTLGLKSSASVGRNQLWCMLTSRQNTFVVRSLAASYFLMVGNSKWVTQNELAFFLASGYGNSFYAFICLFECLCAIGLVIDPLVVPTVALLWIEMLGAIYTHFHNYLAKGASDPLSNSLDAFRMLVVLSFIALASKHTGTELEGRRVVWIK